jgi:signal recognition particle subunit SRP54
VFDTLSERLRKTLGTLTGRGRISEADVDAAMREVRLALLEADVNFKVVKDFVARVREKAVGADVLASLTAGQQVVKIVNDELVELLSAGDRIFHLSGNPAVVAMVGLQGSGKTTSTAKGGIAFAIARDLGLPIRFIGTGETLDDLAEFDARQFVEALFE